MDFYAKETPNSYTMHSSGAGEQLWDMLLLWPWPIWSGTFIFIVLSNTAMCRYFREPLRLFDVIVKSNTHIQATRSKFLSTLFIFEFHGIVCDASSMTCGSMSHRFVIILMESE